MSICVDEGIASPFKREQFVVLIPQRYCLSDLKSLSSWISEVKNTFKDLIEKTECLGLYWSE